MQTNPILRLFRGSFPLLLVLLVLLAAQVLLVIGLISLLRRDKGLRAQVFHTFNPVTLAIAGRRFSPFARLSYRGRRSGRTYVTPVRAYPFGDGFVLGLTWGPEVDWCRNVMATGNGTLTWHGREYPLERPKLIPATSALAAYPVPIKLAMMAGAAQQCLWLHRPSEDSQGARAGASLPMP